MSRFPFLHTINKYLKDQPRGVRFEPTDIEVLQYLEDKMKDKNYSEIRVIGEVLNLNQYEPWELFPEDILGEELFVYSKLALKKQKGKRQTNAGSWKSWGADKEIVGSDNKKIGTRKTLIFRPGKPGSTKKNKNSTNWSMHEYKLLSSFKSEEEWVLCKIIRKKTSESGIASSSEINSLPPQEDFPIYSDDQVEQLRLHLNKYYK